jgi:hypothetical protein
MKTQIMVVEDAVKFWGVPHENKEFDTYLTSVGILERPSLETSPMAACANSKAGFVFIFGSKTSYEKYYGAATEGGLMIFEKIQLYGSTNSSGLEQYREPLPFGLSFNMAKNRVENILGVRNMEQTSGPSNITYSWFNYKKFAISVCFLPSDEGVSHISISKSQLRDL